MRLFKVKRMPNARESYAMRVVRVPGKIKATKKCANSRRAERTRERKREEEIGLRVEWLTSVRRNKTSKAIGLTCEMAHGFRAARSRISDA